MAQGPTVGMVANPASSRDIRRLVADGAVVSAHSKITTLKRVLSGLAGTGVGRVIAMTDSSGISGGILRASQARSAAHWPRLDFVEAALTMGPEDTRHAVCEMVAADVQAIVVLGGDGTNNVVADVCGTVPVLSLSTGTNNAFPGFTEPTVAGLAAGLIATGAVPVEAATHRAKALRVSVGDQRWVGLVDVAIIDDDLLGAAAVGVADPVCELYLAFAEPGAIGWSALGAAVRPTCRTADHGLALEVGGNGTAVLAPLAPGRVVTTTIDAVSRFELGTTLSVRLTKGVIAIDGERTVRFDAASRPRIQLCPDGPVVIDPHRVLRLAASADLFSRP